MPATNDFQPVAVAAGANVLTQANYLALLSTIIADGLTSGVVDSPTLNKILRQSSFMSAMLGQFIVDATGASALDDGVVANLKAGLIAALNSTNVFATPTTGDRSTKVATTQMFSTEFLASLSGTGYQKLPSGLIIQWNSSFATSAAGVATWTFPIAFPNAIVGDFGNATTGAVASQSVSFSSGNVNNVGIAAFNSSNAFVATNVSALVMGY